MESTEAEKKHLSDMVNNCTAFVARRTYVKGEWEDKIPKWEH